MVIRAKMRGLWLENQTLSLRDDLPIPTIKPNEALVRVLLAGICGTDLQLLKGYYPYCGIPGHEFVGEVVNAPNAPHLLGKRVVGEINISCGQCVLCKAGLRSHCVNREVLGIKTRNGAFAQYLALPTENLHLIPNDLSNETAVFTEPVAAAAQILHQVHISPESRVLLIGAGRLGLLIAQVINSTHCHLQVVVRHDKQHHILQRLNIEPINEQQLPVHQADIVIEATGAASGLHAAMHAVRPRGTVVLKSTYAGKTSFDFSNVVVNEITIIGSRCGPFDSAISKLTEGTVDPTHLIERRFSLSESLSAFDYAAKSGTLKTLLDFT